MNPTDLAAEAFEKIHNLNFASPSYREQGIAIIQTCIEKAFDEGYERGAIDGVLNERESRAAHASEQIDEHVLDGRVDPELGTTPATASEPRCVFCHALLPKDAGEGQPVIGTVICKGCAALPHAGDNRSLLARIWDSAAATPAKPDSASTGKDWTETPDYLINRLETLAFRLRQSLMGKAYTKRENDAQVIEKQIIPRIKKLLATPPSGGGEEWTVVNVPVTDECQVKNGHGQTVVTFRTSERFKAERIINDHNATLRGEISSPEATEVQRDTKRLDWLLSFIEEHGAMGVSNLPWTIVKDEDGFDTEDATFDREAIDAAMKEQA